MTRRDWLWMLLLVGGVGCTGTSPHDSDGLLFHVPPPNAITTQPTPAVPAQPSAGASPYAMTPQPQGPSQEAPAVPPTASEPTRQPASYGPEDPPASSPPPPTIPNPAPPPTVATPPDKPAVVVLRSLLEQPPQAATAVALLNGYSPANQEILLSLLTLCAQISEDGDKTKPENFAVAIQVMEKTAERLRDRASLVLDKMYFCKWIEKFGVFETLPEGQAYTPGSLIHIYVELRNFASVQREQCYETHLASTIKLLDNQNHVAAQWGFTDRTRPERSQTLRHDYFINYSLRIPENIPPGKYQLLLRVDDLPTRRSAEKPLALDIAPRPVGVD